MKFRIQVERVDGSTESHWETYDEDTKDAQKWAEELIAWFNGTVRPGESKRRLLAVEVVDSYSIKDHTWSKTNLVTLQSPQGFYDSVKCSRCGVVARRYGMRRIVRQNPFRAKKFERCDTAMEVLC